MFFLLPAPVGFKILSIPLGPRVVRINSATAMAPTKFDYELTKTIINLYCLKKIIIQFWRFLLFVPMLPLSEYLVERSNKKEKKKLV